MPWPQGQSSAALSGRVISPPDRTCQRSSSTNCRIMWKNFTTQRSLDICGPCAVLEPQSCDVLTITYAMNSRMPVGAAGLHLSGTGDFNEPVAFPHAAEKHREICTSLTFEIAAGLLVSDSRISIRATRDAPGSSLIGGGNRVWIERRSCRMLVEFGGTQA